MKNAETEQIGLRIKTARLLRGLSMDDLCRMLGGIVSKQMISNYERSINIPNPIFLDAITQVLKLPVDYFSNRNSVIRSIELRYKGNLSAKEYSQLKSVIQTELSSYIDLEKTLCLKNKFMNPISRVPIRSNEDIEKAVDLLRKRWKLTNYNIPYLCSTLENEGIRIIEIPYDNDSFDGMCGIVSGIRQPFIAINKHFTTERRRFTIAHELGHILLNIDDTFKDKERPCNYFAGAFLLSRQALEYELGPHRKNLSLEELVNIRERSGVSVAAIVHRAYDLGIISRKYYDHLYDEHINNNKLEKGWGDYKLSDIPKRYKLLKARAVSEGLIPTEYKHKDLNITIL